MDQATVSRKRRQKDAISSYQDVLDSEEDDDSQRISEWVASTSRHVSTHVTDRGRRSYTTSYLSGVDHPHIPTHGPSTHNRDLDLNIYAHVDPHLSGNNEDKPGSEASGKDDGSDGCDTDGSEPDEVDIAEYLASANVQSNKNMRSTVLHEWIPHRNALLEELHRHDGRDLMNSCSTAASYLIE